MPLNIGISKIPKLYLGSEEIKKAYLGSSIVFGSSQPVESFDWGEEGSVADEAWFNRLNEYLAKYSGSSLKTNNGSSILGTTKSVTLTTPVLGTTTHLIRVIGVDQDADNTVTFQTANCLNQRTSFSSSGPDEDDLNNDNISAMWTDSFCKAKAECKNYKKALPGYNASTDTIPYIKIVKKGTCPDTNNSRNGTPTYNYEDVWLPSEREMGLDLHSPLSTANSSETKAECTYGKNFSYAYYTNDGARIKYLGDTNQDTTNQGLPWERSRQYKSNLNYMTCCVNINGLGTYANYWLSRGLAPAFVVGNKYHSDTPHIYGATWDGTSTTKWTRTDDAADFADPNPYVAGATTYGSPFDNIMPWAGMTIEERTGGTMVKIPKFWYQLYQNTEGTPSSGMTIKIANEPLEGFSVSPAHMDRGDGKGERDFVYVGRYHCTESDYKSRTGEKPKRTITRATARTEIHGLGSNIWQMDFATRFTIQLLYLVEFADWNSQACIGKGCNNNGNIENMGYTDSMPYHTGTIQPSRDTYGCSTQYRYIEGLWDNVEDWEDGCYNDDNGVNIILNPNNYSDTTGGISIGIPISSYPSAFTVNTNAGFATFCPAEFDGSSTTGMCDSWGFNASYPAISTGGSAGNDNNGLFQRGYSLDYIVSGYIGSRLQELP